MRLTTNGIQVEPEAIEAMATAVMEEADATLSLVASMSDSTAGADSGAGPVELASSALIGAWRIQLSLLSLVTRSLASALSGSAGRYLNTELGIAGSLRP